MICVAENYGGSINLELSFLRKRKKTIACNFQTIAINSFVIAHDMMGNQMRTYVYLLISSYCFMMAEL